MAVEAWPTLALPKPTRNLQAIRESTVMRTKFDDGKIRQRRRFTEHRDTFRVTWRLTDNQLEFLRGWVEYKVSSGNDWFTMDVPYGGGYVNQTVRLVDGKLFTRHLSQGVLDWDVSVVVEIENIADTAEVNIDDLTATGINVLDEFVRLRIFLDIHWPLPRA